MRDRQLWGTYVTPLLWCLFYTLGCWTVLQN